MINQPLVSVIINCYNSEKYLPETIDSLIAQTYTNWEAIFWDNCSTDKTAEIIKKYEESRFRYFLADKNTPLGEARNLALEKVKGEYLCFLDSDDIWEKDFLKISCEVLKRGDYLGVFSNYTNWNFKKGEKEINNSNVISGKYSFKDAVVNYKIGMSACIVRTSTVKDNHIIFNSSYQLIEDLDFFLKILEFGMFYYCSDVLYHYRIHNENSSSQLKDGWADEYYTLCNYLTKKHVHCGKGYLELGDLNNIKEKALYYDLERNMKNGNRIRILQLLFTSKCVVPKYWSRLIYVFFGKSVYNFVRKCVKL